MLLNLVSFYNFCREILKNEVIEIYTVLRRLKKKNAQVCMYSLADLNIGHCVELTFLEGKLGRYTSGFLFDEICKFEIF